MFSEIYRDVFKRIRITKIAHIVENIIARDEKKRIAYFLRDCIRIVIMEEIIARINPGIHPQTPIYPAPFHIPSLVNITFADSYGEPDISMAIIDIINARLENFFSSIKISRKGLFVRRG